MCKHKHLDEFDELEAFHDTGTVAEFLAWVDSPVGTDWLDPRYENYLIRRDTVRKAGFAVMRREDQEVAS